MAMFKAGKKIDSMFHAGKKVSSMYRNGEKIYSDREPRYLLCSNGAQWILPAVRIDPDNTLSLKMSAAMIPDANRAGIQANGTSIFGIYIGVDSSGKYVYPGSTYGEEVSSDGLLHVFSLGKSSNDQSSENANISYSTDLDEEEIFDIELPPPDPEPVWIFEIDENKIVNSYPIIPPGYASNFFIFAMNYNASGSTPDSFITQKLEYIQIIDQGSVIADMWAVPEGKTLYGATSPAPSNCLYCKVRDQYYENLGSGNFTIEQI